MVGLPHFAVQVHQPGKCRQVQGDPWTTRTGVSTGARWADPLTALFGSSEQDALQKQSPNGCFRVVGLLPFAEHVHQAEDAGKSTGIPAETWF